MVFKIKPSTLPNLEPSKIIQNHKIFKMHHWRHDQKAVLKLTTFCINFKMALTFRITDREPGKALRRGRKFSRCAKRF